MELRIIKPSFKYVAGQWLFVQVPEISSLQWHPVSQKLPSRRLGSNLTVIRLKSSSQSPLHRKTHTFQSISVKLVTGPKLLETDLVLAHLLLPP